MSRRIGIDGLKRNLGREGMIDKMFFGTLREDSEGFYFSCRYLGTWRFGKQRIVDGSDITLETRKGVYISYSVYLK